MLHLLTVRNRQLTRRDRNLALEKVLNTTWDGRPHPGLELRSEALGSDDSAGSAGRAWLYLDHACQGGGWHWLGGQLGHSCHVTGQTLRHARSRVSLNLRLLLLRLLLLMLLLMLRLQLMLKLLLLKLLLMLLGQALYCQLCN